jgi:hypothetical protein
VVATACIVTVMAVVVGVVLLANPDDDASRTAGPASGPPSTTVQDASTSAQVPPPPPPVVNTPTVTAPSSVTNPPTTATAASDTPEQLQAAVSDYYALMPTNLQEGWRRLTTDYQTNHAGGFSGYQTFWDAIGQVDIRDVSATSPTAVTATISYFFKDGRITTEQTTFGLVAEDGQWKIGSSTVITSRTASS